MYKRPRPAGAAGFGKSGRCRAHHQPVPTHARHIRLRPGCPGMTGIAGGMTSFFGRGNRIRLVYPVLPTYGTLFFLLAALFPVIGSSALLTAVLPPPLWPTFFVGYGLGEMAGQHMLFGFLAICVHYGTWLAMARCIVWPARLMQRWAA
ncbi:hypothetical protein CENSYa_0668 [Cenarchaeum symbiosum A]|uniref:Uncharacterized protein n=1 Tax=Cenarchaeum symbiosum (strain A) TaxID=414004 RepID=A0RVD4_CENSY|nr:hypothetical protein CENSYa_0668 [Cenarchaeum symbiosum A]